VKWFVLVIVILALTAFQYPGQNWQQERQQLLAKLEKVTAERDRAIVERDEAVEEIKAQYHRGEYDVCMYGIAMMIKYGGYRPPESPDKMCNSFVLGTYKEDWFNNPSDGWSWPLVSPAGLRES